jgi:hypothetical protein
LKLFCEISLIAAKADHRFQKDVGFPWDKTCVTAAVVRDTHSDSATHVRVFLCSV